MNSLVIAAVVISGCASNAEMEKQGRRDAERDFRAGKAKLFWRGKPEDEHKEYAKLLAEKCNVTLTFRPKDISSREASYIIGYNERVEEKIEASYGEGTLDKIKREAKELHAARRKPN